MGDGGGEDKEGGGCADAEGSAPVQMLKREIYRRLSPEPSDVGSKLAGCKPSKKP
jgi:hypothetical protein